MPTNPLYPRSHLDADQVLKHVYDDDNQRLRVDAEVTATIVGAQEVVITHTDDSIKIGDGTDFLTINSDGSINVYTTEVEAANEEEILQYAEVSSVAASVETTILTYTVPSGYVNYLHRIEVAGTNIAEYKIKINAVVKAKRYTYFGNSLNTEFDFTAGPRRGYKVNAGDIITVTVLHSRPTVGNFNARLQGLQVD